jgi:prepilin-type processing-associated H-X9-DG protein
LIPREGRCQVEARRCTHNQPHASTGIPAIDHIDWLGQSASTLDGPLGIAAAIHCAAAMRIARPCGLATLDRLDGELIVLDGAAYQARSSGEVVAVPPAATTPFAAITPFETDGMFGINSRTRARDITDGRSKTVAFSESNLGSGPKATTSRDGIQTDTGYGFVFTTPLTDAACSRPFYYNFTDLRGFSWANGEYRTTLYNHRRLPNSNTIDCLAALLSSTDPARQYAGYGWRTARSRHSGGVTAGMADGSVRFIGDEVDAAVWTALATKAGKEATSDGN